MVRRHNTVCARLRLGHRRVWQVAEVADAPHFSCKLCDAPHANNLEHYRLECSLVTDLIPQGLSRVETCKILLSGDNLDVILTRHPHFGGR